MMMTNGLHLLVENAREVRRLIREASFDSTTSDLSLDLRNRNIYTDIRKIRNINSYKLKRFVWLNGVSVW